MPENGFSLLTEYRHWRASLPVGAFMLSSTYLLIVDFWPQLVSRPGSIFGQAGVSVSRLASPLAVWLMLIGAALMLGAWWGEVSSWVIAVVQRLSLNKLPLEASPSSWSFWQRSRLPIHISEMQNLQNAMRGTPDYADLLQVDERAAYQRFLREVLSSPYTGIIDAMREDAELIRSITDLRLSAGLLPWLPLSLLALAMNAEAPPKGFVSALWIAAAITIAAVVHGVIRQARATSTLAVRSASTPERLAHHARNAQGAGEPD